MKSVLGVLILAVILPFKASASQKLGDYKIGQNFLAVDLGETIQLPFPIPNTMGGVGQTQYIACENGRVRSFSKDTGKPDGILDVGADTFWTAGAGAGAFSDPHIEYDAFSNRWIAIGITRSTTPNSLLIAYSDSDPISNATIWNFRNFPVNTVENSCGQTGDEDSYADFPQLGINSVALFITANMFSSQQEFLGSNIYVLPKDSLFSSANPPEITVFRALGDVENNTPTLQPVNIFDPEITNGYFIGADAVTGTQLLLWTMTSPDDTPVLTGPQTIAVSPFQVNYNETTDIFVNHKGNSEFPDGRLDAFGDLLSAHIRNGSLWTTHSINVDAGGNSGPLVDVSRVGVRWYEIVDLTTTPVARQVGTIFDATFPNDEFQLNCWAPSIMTNPNGEMIVGFSVAGVNSYINAGFAGRTSNDAYGTTRPYVLYTESSTAYNPEADSFGNAVRKWGNFSKVSIDPVNNTFWVSEEFCPATNLNGCQVVNVKKIQ